MKKPGFLLTFMVLILFLNSSVFISFANEVPIPPNMNDLINGIPSNIPIPSGIPSGFQIPSGTPSPGTVIPSGVPIDIPIPSDSGPEITQADLDALFVLPTPIPIKEPTIADFSKKQVTEFDKQIEEIVFSAIENHLDTITPIIEELILKNVNAIVASIEKDVKAKADSSMDLVAPKAQIDLSQIPDSSVLNNIPKDKLETVKNLARKKFLTSLKTQLETVTNGVKTESNNIIETCKPQIQAQIKAIIPEIIKNADTEIENKLSESIEQSILEKLEDPNFSLPPEYEELSDSQIQEKSKSVAKNIMPRVEELIRKKIKDNIKEQINTLIANTIEKPLSQKFGPELDSVTEQLVSDNLSKVPNYINSILPLDFINTSVRTNVGKIKTWIPQMISVTKDNLFKDINSFVDAEISAQNKVYFEGKEINMDVKPRIMNNRLLVPFRAIAETLGAKVSWDAKTKTVTMTKEGKEVKLILGSNIALVNGQKVMIDTPATSIESRTLVPVRFLSETFGLNVNYEPNWKMVKID